MREIVFETANAKKRIKLLQGKTVTVRYNRGRNKTCDYVGKITDLYPQIFTFVTENETLSFSYSDVVTKNLRIFPAK